MTSRLKRIPVARLRTGMHIHKLCGSWLSHPFWKNAFLVDSPSQIAAIADSGITEVWIDTARGLDVVEDTLAVAVAEPHTAPSGAESGAGASTLAEEAERAERLCAEGRGLVLNMFEEARMGRAVPTGSAAQLVVEISASVARNPHALISVARLKTADDYTYMHSVAVCGLMIALARRLGLDEERTREAGLAGLLHDVGKMAVPATILNKPGALTEAEFAQMRSHPVQGHRMLQRSPGINDTVLDVCLHHHEKIDGRGYPHGLGGERISEASRMGAVCDVYDAITSNRAYKSAWSPAESIRRMAGWSGSHFDSRIFEAFVKTVGIYPAGVLVRLRSARLGVVTGQGAGNLLAPEVQVFYCIRSRRRIPATIVKLADERDDAIVGHENPADWGIADLDSLWRR